jgi:hypothetical protein
MDFRLNNLILQQRREPCSSGGSISWTIWDSCCDSSSGFHFIWRYLLAASVLCLNTGRLYFILVALRVTRRFVWIPTLTHSGNHEIGQWQICFASNRRFVHECSLHLHSMVLLDKPIDKQMTETANSIVTLHVDTIVTMNCFIFQQEKFHCTC